MDKIDELLSRGVEKIYPSKNALDKVLRSGKKLKLYQGFDPTGKQLHIGHMTGFMKLRQFQKLGHQVIFLIGDGTGQAGDPSGKSKARDSFLTHDQLRKNAKGYVMQTRKIISFIGKNPVEILYNSEWLNKLKLVDILKIAQNFSLQQLEERNLFVARKKRGETINMREFLYPLLQGYDSVAMKVDLELGGSDQTFNMLCGRTLAKNMLNREKFVMTTPLLTDSTGQKIGKTEDNVIALTTPPVELYGMIMNLPDEIISHGFEYLTEVPMKEVQSIAKAIAAGKNPMAFKKKLAFELIAILNNRKAAQKAQIEFERVFQNRKLPKQIPAYNIEQKTMNLVDLLVKTKIFSSRSEAKRLVQQGAVDIDGQTITDQQSIINPKNGMIIRAGKAKFVKISAKP